MPPTRSLASRHYHNLAHIEDCLGALARVDNLSAAEREILSEAIWWHDVVYDATRSDNEELSARLADFTAREEISNQRYEAQSKRYLEELRRSAMIEIR